MGVNAGAFIGIMLCGWVGEKIGWSYGFGLAGIFMLLGMLQFYYAQSIFGSLGDKPKKTENNLVDTRTENKTEKLNTFSILDYSLVLIFIISALIFIINEPLSKIGNIQALNF